jgi:nicotinate (nicotinamide) nucleotide adenylyltransferase
MDKRVLINDHDFISQPFMKGRVGILGGSFDPPHLGHLEMGQIAIESGLIDFVLYIPCLQHAFSKNLTSFEHRFKMLKLMLSENNLFMVSEVEKHIETPGRTLSLIEKLSKSYPSCVFRLLLGADIYFEKDQWFKFDKIEELAPPIWFARKGIDKISNALRAPLDISSTKIRDELFNKKKTEGLDPLVYRYIIENNLYGA